MTREHPLFYDSNLGGGTLVVEFFFVAIPDFMQHLICIICTWREREFYSEDVILNSPNGVAVERRSVEWELDAVDGREIIAT